MDLEKNPAYLRAMVDAVKQFKAALEDFLWVHEVNTTFARGLAPAVFPKEGVDSAEVQRLASAVAVAAGRAAPATGLTRMYVAVQGAGMIDPVAAWASITQPKPVLEPANILDACDQMVGRLETMIVVAELPEEVPATPLEARKAAGGSMTFDSAGHPRVFVGSSSEGRPIAQAIQSLLDTDCEVEVWDQGVFGLTGTTLESLVKASRTFEFAVLVVTPDDMTVSRDVTKATARDNVIFELGLFMGALGRERTFIVYERTNRPDLPSDLAGVTAATFKPHSSGNMKAALGAASTDIRNAIKAVLAAVS